jgi:hypothetical protein
MAIDQDQGAVRGACAQTVNCRRVGARTVGAAEGACAGIAEACNGRNGGEKLLDRGRARRLDGVTVHSDDVFANHGRTANSSTRDGHCFDIVSSLLILRIGAACPGGGKPHNRGTHHQPACEIARAFQGLD